MRSAQYRTLHFNKIKQFKIIAPIGTIIIPKEVMTEQELREYAMQLVSEADRADVWREKVEKDTIESVVDWLKQLGYQINQL